MPQIVSSLANRRRPTRQPASIANPKTEAVPMPGLEPKEASGNLTYQASSN